MTAFIFFSSVNSKLLKEKNPSLKLPDYAKLNAEDWNSMSKKRKRAVQQTG